MSCMGQDGFSTLSYDFLPCSDCAGTADDGWAGVRDVREEFMLSRIPGMRPSLVA